MFFFSNRLRCWRSLFNSLLFVDLSFVLNFFLLLILIWVRLWFFNDRLVLVPGGSQILLLFNASLRRNLGQPRFLVLASPQGRFVDALSLIFSNIFLEGHPIFLHIDLKLEFIIFREISLILMPTLIIFLKISNQLIHINLIISNLKILIVFPLDHQKQELMFFILGVVWQVEIETTGVDDKNWDIIDNLKVGLNWNLIFIEFLSTQVSFILTFAYRKSIDCALRWELAKRVDDGQ